MRIVARFCITAPVTRSSGSNDETMILIMAIRKRVDEVVQTTGRLGEYLYSCHALSITTQVDVVRLPADRKFQFIHAIHKLTPTLLFAFWNLSFRKCSRS